MSVTLGKGWQVNPDGWPLARQFLTAAFDPALDARFLAVIADATLTTVTFAVLGAAVAVVIAIPGSFLLSQLRWTSGRSVRAPWFLARAGFAVPRGLHESVWAVVLVLVLGLDPLVAILAIGIPFGAITARIYADLLDNAPRSGYEAIRMAGGTPRQAFYYGLVPHVAADITSYALYRFECSIRSATAVGMIGAGGLGFQLILSYQSLNFDELWTTIFVLGILCALTDAVSNAIRRRRRMDVSPSSNNSTREIMRRGDRRVARSIGITVVATLIVATWILSRVDIATLWSPPVRSRIVDIVGRVWPLDLSRDSLSELLRLSVETLQMSVVAVVVSTGGGFLAAVLAVRPHDRTARGRTVVSVAARALLLGCRAIPPLVWALFFLFVMTPGPLVGALALAAYNLGVLGRLVAEVIENSDVRAATVVDSAGVGGIRAWMYAVWPQVAPNAVALGLYRWEVVIRETVIVGLVGAGGLGRLLADQMVAFDWSGIATTVVALIALTLMVDLLTARATVVVR